MSKANERRQGMSGVRTSGPVLGGMLLLAAWFGWSSYAQWREDAIAQTLEQARDRAVQDVRQAMTSQAGQLDAVLKQPQVCLLYTSPSPRDRTRSRMPSSA